MGTSIRPELSLKNEYWISRHRYYELKHFCLQYPIWEKAVNSIDGFSQRPDLLIVTGNVGDPTSRAAIAREFYHTRMEMIEKCSKNADPVIGFYIFKAVTYGYSYDALKTKFSVPCCKDIYYNIYRKFFWLLSMERQ